MSTPYAQVIGDPIAQSKSPAIHNFWLTKLGREPSYRAESGHWYGVSAFFTF